MNCILKPLDLIQASLSVDVMCRVVDNYGDAGVCLRLARSLVKRYRCSVRLFCDDLELLYRLQPQPLQGLAFLPWHMQAQLAPADAVICGFGCELDAHYLRAMCDRVPQSKWIHLEYLSAEPWVETTHGLDSRHPRLALTQRFINPGFTLATGGLLKDRVEGLPHTQDEALFALEQFGVVCNPKATRVLVFAYDYADFEPLLAAAQSAQQPIHWLLCATQASERLQADIKRQTNHAVSLLPFVSQVNFEVLLKCAHKAWVRGEDSAVQAMLLGVPCVWQLYAQDDGAHTVKLKAFLTRMSQVCSVDDMQQVQQVYDAANGQLSPDMAQKAWHQWLHASTPWQAVASAWQADLMQSVPDLAQTVYDYISEPPNRM